MAYIDQSDLEAVLGPAEVVRLFDEDGDGSADPPLVSAVCESASALIDSFELQGWSAEAIARLVGDPLIRRHLSWVALHHRAQGKTAWRDSNGVAMFRQEYVDACTYFDKLAKGQARSRKESEAGENPVARGRVQTAHPQFVFAPSRHNPRGPGGF
jgi:hypothetical protein